MMTRLAALPALLALLLASSHAFTAPMVCEQSRPRVAAVSRLVAPFSHRSPPEQVSAPKTSALSLMADAEIEAIMTQANDCAEGECSLDEVGDLVDVLKGQQKELSDRVDKLRALIKDLEKVNESPNRKTDEVRDTVRALFRVFMLGDKASGNDYPALSRPSGWSGEVGSGPTTAYDALKPKPYKK